MADVLAMRIVGYRGAFVAEMAEGTVNPIVQPIPLIVWIEVKSPTGKQSPEQKQFQQEVESVGCKYILARSLDDVMKVL